MRTEPFKGYRAWRIFDWQNAILGAAWKDYQWEGPRLSVPPDDLSALPVSGGFHAFTTLAGARDYVRSWLDNAETYTNNLPQGGALGWEKSFVWALGMAEGFGTVAEYERGWRASGVVIRSLSVSHVWDEAFRTRLADRYQCDVKDDGYSILYPPTTSSPITEHERIKRELLEQMKNTLSQQAFSPYSSLYGYGAGTPQKNPWWNIIGGK